MESANTKNKLLMCKCTTYNSPNNLFKPEKRTPPIYIHVIHSLITSVHV